MAYTLSEIRPDDQRNRKKLLALLEGEGITLDGNLDYTCGLFDEDYQWPRAAPSGVPCAALQWTTATRGRACSTRWSPT